MSNCAEVPGGFEPPMEVLQTASAPDTTSVPRAIVDRNRGLARSHNPAACLSDTCRESRGEKMGSRKGSSNSVVWRPEDMSPDGRLTLVRQDDGDIIVEVRQPSHNQRWTAASVEFCLSGGRSPHTLRALRSLFVAMARDAAGEDLPDGCNSYSPVFGGGYCANCLVDGAKHKDQEGGEG